MILCIPADAKFSKTKTEITFLVEEETFTMSRMINGTCKGVTVPCKEADLYKKLTHAGKLSDSDFAWLCDF